MSDTIERLLVRIDATTDVLRRELKMADKELSMFDKTVGRSLRGIERSFNDLKRQVSGALAGIFTVVAIKQFTSSVLDAADTMVNLRAQLKLVSDTQEEANRAFEKLYKISNDTGQALDSTVTLYARMARNTKELGVSQNELLRITETVNKAFVVSGANSREASNAMIQLSQAFGKGRLDGEEFNAIAEQAPIILQAIAKQMNTTVGALKQYAEDGKITVEVLRGAFERLSSSIDEDFSQIPVTVGRAMQALSNTMTVALGDVEIEGFTESLKELQDTVTDPSFSQSLNMLANAAVKMTEWFAKAAISVADFGKALGVMAARATGAIDIGNLADVQDRIAFLRKEIEGIEKLPGFLQRFTNYDEFKKQLNELLAILPLLEKDTIDLAKANNQLEEVTSNATKRAEEYWKALKNRKLSEKELKKTLKESEKTLDSIAKAHEKNTKALEDGYEAIDAMVEETERYIEQQEWELSLIGKTQREIAILTALREKGARATEEQREAIERNAAEIYDANVALEAAQKSQEQWNDALVRTRERIDEAFAGAWKGAFDSFKDFADSLKNAFESLLAELAHMAITRPIVMKIGAALGLGGGSAGAMAGGTSGPMSLLQGISSIGTSAIGGLGQLAFLGARAGIPGMTTMASNAFLTANTIGPWGMFGAGLGTLGGGLLGSQLYGPTSGLGSAGGGLAATAFLTPALSFLGPAAPFAAGLLGSIGGGFVESLFGGKNNGNNSGKAILDLATGGINAFGVGKTFEQANVDAAQQLANAASQLAAAFGVTSGQYEFQVGNRFGVKLNGQKVGDAGDALSAVLEDLLDKTGKLTPEIKKLIKAFDGTLEETVRFTMAIGTIADLSKRNPALEAMRDFRDGMELAGMTATEVYFKQVDAIGKMTDAFDGSLESTEALSQALSINKQAAYDLTMILAQVNEQIRGTVRSNIEYYKSQTQTSDERIKYLEDVYKFVFGGLEQAVDPAKIQQFADILFSISRELFDMAPEDLQRSNVDFFIDRDKAIGDLVSERLEAAGVSIAETQQDINAKVTDALNNAASGLNQAANTMQSAAEIFMQAVMYFTGNTSAQYTEVTA